MQKRRLQYFFVTNIFNVRVMNKSIRAKDNMVGEKMYKVNLI